MSDLPKCPTCGTMGRCYAHDWPADAPPAPAAPAETYGIRCEGCGKVMAQHDAMARCPAPAAPAEPAVVACGTCPHPRECERRQWCMFAAPAPDAQEERRDCGECHVPGGCVVGKCSIGAFTAPRHLWKDAPEAAPAPDAPKRPPLTTDLVDRLEWLATLEPDTIAAAIARDALAEVIASRDVIAVERGTLSQPVPGCACTRCTVYGKYLAARKGEHGAIDALREAQEDAARLEWMAVHLLREASMRFDDGTFRAVHAWSIASAGTDLRAAVDAAMAAGK